MFGFMKKHSDKDKEEKERKKKEKKERKAKEKDKKPMTQDELHRLEELKKGLFRRSSNSSNRSSARGESMAVAYQDPGDKTSDSSETGGSSREESMDNIAGHSYASQKQLELTKPHKPPVMPKPKKGILKGKSSYGPDIPNQGVHGNLDDEVTIEKNTIVNEMLSGTIMKDGEEIPEVEITAEDISEIPARPAFVKSGSGRSREGPPKFAPPPPPTGTPPTGPTPPSPSEKTFGDMDLPMPHLEPPRCPKPRDIALKRQPKGDFGVSLRRGTVMERSADDNTERKRVVIFAEPSPHHQNSGLLPGDRLVEVNNVNVENANREEIIDLIKKSTDCVVLTVQPIPELSELSMRSGIDGAVVHLAESKAKTGTLQRSGSMRFKSRSAKSEDQVASEKAWLTAEKVWLVHKKGFTAARVLKAEDLPEGRCKVKLEHNGQELEVDEDDIEKANPPQFDRVEDLATLRHLNESSALHTLRQRYGSNLIHTYAGRSVITINPMCPLAIYSDKVIQMFRGCKPEDMPPHIFATAQIAYRNLLSSRHDQSIIMMGRSGSGKTTNAHHILSYLTAAAGSINNFLTTEKLTAINTLLNTFGHSRTIMNTSASKFTQLFSLDFDHSGQIAGGSVQVLMMEKSRVVKRPEGEPTYHVFYQMLAGLETNIRNELQLQNMNEPNIFMTPLQRAEDRQKGAQSWGKVRHCMNVIGVSESEEKALVSVMAAIYHLGVAAVAKGANNKYQFSRPQAAQKAASVLGTTVEELSRTIFNPSQSTPTRSNFRNQGDKSGNGEVIGGVEALEGFVMGLYSELFSALVSLINRSLSTTYRTMASISVLDMPGFQNPLSCGRQGGATFEDLCHNYAQERLQLLFHDAVFTSQQDLYAQENIECDFEFVRTSPSAMVNLIDKPPEQNVVRGHDVEERDRRGLLWLMDEEAIFPGSSDDSFLERLFLHHGSANERLSNIQNAKENAKEKENPPESKGASLLKKSGDGNTFLLNHYQGTNPVQYNAKGWLKQCRENPVSRNVNVFLQDSQKEDISMLFTTVRGPMSSLTGGSVVGLEGNSSLKRASSIRRSYATGSAGLKRKSVCLQIKFQMDSLVDMLRRTQMYFVHCLLPQYKAGLCDIRALVQPINKGGSSTEEIMVHVPLLRSQIRGSEIIEAIRIHRQGFPEHMLFSEFRRRFEVLAPVENRPASTLDDKQAVEKLLSVLEVDPNTFRLGLSQVFFRAGGLAQLEDTRDEKITGTIVALQAFCRGHLGRQKLKKLKVQHMAVTCIQRNVRKFMAIRNWPWWRLYTKLQPVLNVHRTEEELRVRDAELEHCKLELEKLEKERNEYKLSSEKLETKLSEVSADLAAEHTASSQASELLDGETGQRLKLQRELNDIQGKYQNLQRKHEATELDLMHTRLLAASVDGDYDEEDGEGDSIYREKFERAKRELDFMKKKLHQQREEDQEQYDSSKKLLERKLGEVMAEDEEHQRQVGNLKRKSQRLNADMQDLKLHLEEQISRNSELEKKQRKFDNEIQKVNNFLREEKAQREKLQRERDELATNKFTLEQEVKSQKLDNEFLSDKMARLERDLLDFTTSEGPDDKQLLNLKKLRGDLEAKLQEQEEELDDQAGTILQLEQAKLKLEMEAEKMRQQHLRDIEEKENEVEEMRATTQKKVRHLESQVEEEYEEKQKAAKDKRELERKLKTLSEIEPISNRDTEKRLRRDLRRTRALLRDAQMMLDKQKEGQGSRIVVRQLRNQLEDAEFATAAAVKARKGFEMEVSDVQTQLDDVTRAKQECEDRCMGVSREKNDLLTKLEENDEDMADILKKYKAVVQQQSVDAITLIDQSKQIEELAQEKEQLKEQIVSLQSTLAYLQSSTIDKQALLRLETKIRDLESRLDLEQTTRHRAEVQSTRNKELLDKLSDEKSKAQESSMQTQEEMKRLQRQMRDVKEELAESQRREGEFSQRKHDLEKKVESLEIDFEQSQNDLRLAVKRITDLQAIIEDDLESDDVDSDYSGAEDFDSEESDGEDSFLVSRNHSAFRGVNSTDITLDLSHGPNGDITTNHSISEDR